MSALYTAKATQGAGNGLFSTAFIPADTIIGTFTQYLTAQAALQEPHFHAHLQALDLAALPALDEKVILTLFLAWSVSIDHADGETRAWPITPAHIRALPKTIQNGIWAFGQDEGMKATHLWRAIAAKRNVVHRQWSGLGSSLCTFETWQWADSIVSSRCIGVSDAPDTLHVQRDGGDISALLGDALDVPHDPTLCLVPVLDLCNHADVGRRRNARWEVHQGAIHLLATEDIADDIEITISYGEEKTNEELFYNYGFTLRDNENWHVTLKMPAPVQDETGHYWALVAETYGIKDTIRLGNMNLGLSFHPSASRVQQAWKEAGARIYLDDEALCTLLLSSSPDLLQDHKILKLFSQHDTEQKVSHQEIERCCHVAHDCLKRELDALLQSNLARHASVDSGTTASQLILDEQNALRTLLNA